MPKKRNKVNPENSSNIGGRNYEPAYYHGNTQFEKGISETYEQVSDDYKEGTIDQKLEDD
ncbi:YozQ family protein [Lentibacillus salicampi]|uniref:DUF4025 domain-containing protein n=1 Tax=Lentibacillus salicampi TaxID=175306 RepID=A0A4Y9AF40_9BACI|nr:YozQ family protein [Lentibacillus salicampi]TFJ94436.1 DUF4025 domain-containing protein [Lentibacillus salicampi]